MLIREATLSDAEAIAALVNQAYAVEHFFVAGDRTNADAVRGMQATGTFLAVDDGSDDLAACIYTAVSGDRGYFGMLAVAPSAQKRGLGRALIDAVERRASGQGATVMDIKVVNLRSDLLRYYDGLGYMVTGTEPYEHRPVIMPCHFVTMEKRLV